MIGRFAELVIQNDIPLFEKIDKILDDLLLLVGRFRQEPIQFQEESSSDEEEIPEESPDRGLTL